MVIRSGRFRGILRFVPLLAGLTLCVSALPYFVFGKRPVVVKRACFGPEDKASRVFVVASPVSTTVDLVETISVIDFTDKPQVLCVNSPSFADKVCYVRASQLGHSSEVNCGSGEKEQAGEATSIKDPRKVWPDIRRLVNESPEPTENISWRPPVILNRDDQFDSVWVLVICSMPTRHCHLSSGVREYNGLLRDRDISALDFLVRGERVFVGEPLECADDYQPKSHNEEHQSEQRDQPSEDRHRDTMAAIG